MKEKKQLKINTDKEVEIWTVAFKEGIKQETNEINKLIKDRISELQKEKLSVKGKGRLNSTIAELMFILIGIEEGGKNNGENRERPVSRI